MASIDRPAALVTGAAGFIGSHLTRALAADGRVREVALVARVFEEHAIRYVFHLAAYAAEGLSHFIRRFNYTNNVIGSMNLINEAVRHEVKCFVFTSSIAVYGAEQVPMTEELVPQPEDPYGIAKYAVELDLRAANRFRRRRADAGVQLHQ